jgi:pyruvate/2-oxoglutarate dehydrogenase complex dihydrolipoamide acyltransferase (E2) component
VELSPPPEASPSILDELPPPPATEEQNVGETPTAPMAPEPSDAPPVEAPQTEGSRVRRVTATAAARRKAEELGVDLLEVEGTGPNGRITVDDVRRSGE